jgi:signal transduction histidine kinase
MARPEPDDAKMAVECSKRPVKKASKTARNADPERKRDRTATAAACQARLRAVIRRFHGEVGSPLAALGLRLELVRGTKGLDPKVEEVLDSVQAELSKVIDCVRESVAELRSLERDSKELHPE